MADVNDGSWNIREGCKKIGHQLFPEGVVFDDSPKEKIFIHLIGVSASDNRVVILFYRIEIAVKIGIDQTHVEMKLFQWQIRDRGRSIVPPSLVWENSKTGEMKYTHFC